MSKQVTMTHDDITHTARAYKGNPLIPATCIPEKARKEARQGEHLTRLGGKLCYKAGVGYYVYDYTKHNTEMQILLAAALQSGRGIASGFDSWLW